jgi:hypothetical protein
VTSYLRYSHQLHRSAPPSVTYTRALLALASARAPPPCAYTRASSATCPWCGTPLPPPPRGPDAWSAARKTSASACPARCSRVWSLPACHSPKQQGDVIPKLYVASVYFNCFRGMLYVFYIDVVKVDQDVAHVAMVFSSLCPKYFIYFRCILQVFHLDVAKIDLDVAYTCKYKVCFKYFWFSYVRCKCFPGVSDVCYKCFNCFERMLQVFLSRCCKSTSWYCTCCSGTHLQQPPTTAARSACIHMGVEGAPQCGHRTRSAHGPRCGQGRQSGAGMDPM